MMRQTTRQARTEQEVGKRDGRPKDRPRLLRLVLTFLLVLTLLGCEKEPKPELDPDPSPESSESGMEEESGAERGSASDDNRTVTDADRQALFEKVQARGETMIQQRYQVDMSQLATQQFRRLEVALARAVDQSRWQARRAADELVITWETTATPEIMEAIDEALAETKWLSKKDQSPGEVVVGVEDQTALRDEVYEEAITIIRKRLESMNIKESLVLQEDGHIVVEASAVHLKGTPIIGSSESLTISLARNPENSRPLLEPLVEKVNDESLLTFNDYNGSLTAFPGLSGQNDSCEGLRVLVEASNMSVDWIGFEPGQQDGKETCNLWLRQEPPVLDPVEVLNAFPASNPQLQSNYVALELVPSHAQIFSVFTAKHVGELTLIALGDEVLLAPVIRSEIPGGKISIEFGHLSSPDEQLRRATEVSSQLRVGSLPAPLEFISVKRLDPPAP